MKPFWVTFYSYKGGVGRSLALANVAALLVQRGRRVLLIDFDLEAPGLDSFAEFAPAAGKAGVVEYVSEFLRCQSAPDIREFVHPCELPGPLRGQLYVMPAGRRDAAYNRQLARINWAELYESGFGAPFFANWKAAINQHFQPDYVFIDSRTGLTEVGGVCTTQFPDLVMMLFGLNEQNVRGVATVAQSIREADPERVTQMHFVATPVPNLPSVLSSIVAEDTKRAQERRSLLTERMDAAAERLGVKISSTIRYYSPASLSEKLFVLEEGFSRQSLHGDYERLCGQIIRFNRTGLDFLIEQANEAIVAGDTDRIKRLGLVLQRDYPTRAEAVFLHARFAVARNLGATALKLAQRAFNLDPAYDEPFDFLSGHFSRAGQYKRILALFDAKLAHSGGLTDASRYLLQLGRSQVLMALGRYREASAGYFQCTKTVFYKKESISRRFRLAFAVAESFRRANGELNSSLWESIVEVFGLTDIATDAPSPDQAELWQAMHIAFAGVGDLAAARDALRKARRAARGVGEIENIFTVKNHRNVPVPEFLAINEEMLAALDRGELWDGMKLPVATAA